MSHECDREGDTNKPRIAVLWFADKMEGVLRQNDHKGTWDNCSLWYLYRKLLKKIGELGEIMAGAAEGNVIKEAVDVGNYAMMIADRLSYVEATDE